MRGCLYLASVSHPSSAHWHYSMCIFHSKMRCMFSCKMFHFMHLFTLKLHLRWISDCSDSGSDQCLGLESVCGWVSTFMAWRHHSSWPWLCRVVHAASCVRPFQPINLKFNESVSVLQTHAPGEMCSSCYTTDAFFKKNTTFNPLFSQVKEEQGNYSSLSVSK